MSVLRSPLINPLRSPLYSPLLSSVAWWGNYNPSTGFAYDFKLNRYMSQGKSTGITQVVTEGRSTDAYVLDGGGNYILRSANEPAQADGHGLDGFDTIFNQDQSTDLASAVVGTPGTLPTGWSQQAGVGMTTDVVGLGTENGLPFIDLRVTGTLLTTFWNIFFRPFTGATAASGEDWFNAFHVKLIAGAFPSGTQVATLIERNAGGTFLANHFATLSVSSSYLEVNQTAALGNAGTVNVNDAFGFTGAAASEVVDFTIRLRAVHLTKDNPARAIVLTGTGTEGTRDADDTRVVQGDDAGSPTIAPGISADPNELTFRVDWDGVAVGTGVSRYLFEVKNSSNKVISLFFNSSNALLFGGDQTGSFQSITAGTGFDDGLPHTATVYVNQTTSSFKMSVDGETTISGTLTGAVPPNLDEMAIGRKATGGPNNANGTDCRVQTSDGDFYDAFRDSSAGFF